MGTDIAKAALAAGHAVVATGRDPEKVARAVGENENLLAVTLDVTDPAAATAAVQAAVDRFGRIDVLVNNAGNFYAGFFEEITPQDFRAQIETTMFGPINVTRAALPVLRAQRSGLIITISSTAGIAGGEFLTAYAASKFGVEGWAESLAPEVAPFGIRTMIVEPGFFRTELLTPESTSYADIHHQRLRRAHRADRRRVAKHERPAGRGPGQARRRPHPAGRTRSSRRCASPPAPTPSGCSRPGPRNSRNRPTPTASSPATSPTTTPDSGPASRAVEAAAARFARLLWQGIRAAVP